MQIVVFTYQYKNGVSVIECGSTCTGLELVIDVSDNSLCGLKDSELVILSVQDLAGGATSTTFYYNGDVYVTDESLTTLIPKINSCFSCEPTTTCANQDCSFSWALAASDGDQHRSTTIVEDVMLVQPVRQYEFVLIDVNGVAYANSTFWDDSVDGSAAQNVASYIDAIIAYIESLSIPEYIGSINRARNGMSSNGGGVNLLEMYFTAGTTPVTINIQDTTATVSGGLVAGTPSVTTFVTLTLTDTSVVDAGDSISSRYYTITDGNFNRSLTTNPASLEVYSIFTPSFNTNLVDMRLVVRELIATAAECEYDNVGIATIPSADIIACVVSQTPQSGTSS